ncbi:hypothetical protein FA13DRAFT_1736287 [Coprinellus micaceus]|uniref:Nephrocystin 3-like N-terminal domain-containing protein n=1 Tax=Coprinellus micaceus TaxID=71717 RepID=A0A4Y7T1J3_COPMI|nr:hypothetical protein FA13DRAFT_1736287 [Coprinellus micaceus]
MGWIKHGEQDDAPKRILWLSGPVGSGKTAIAGSIADECYKKGTLVASFFFSAFTGSLSQRLNKHFIPALVYSLLQHESIVGYKEEVLAAIEPDPMVFERRLDQQLDSLVLKPLRKVASVSNRSNWPSVILVDGLDECQGSIASDLGPERGAWTAGPAAQKEILCALSRACVDPAFPFLIIIVSRPEPHIRHFFPTSPCSILNIFLDDKYDPDSDIRLFLKATFSDLRRRFNLPSTWASKDVVNILVKEASGQFIYAATVIRFLDNPRLGPPQQLLTRILEWRDSKPFATLDLLYDRILRTSPDPLLAVKWILYASSRGVSSYPAYCKYLLESYPGEVEHVLGALTSLVGLVDANGNPHFYFYHKSLLDFLRDPQRSSDLHVNEESLEHFTRDRYYQTLQARGPQSKAADQPTDPPFPEFLNVFCVNLFYNVDPYREYTSGDVEWWLLHRYKSHQSRRIPKIFAEVHNKCKWYGCLPACDVWRKGILRHCREHGWPMPTIGERLWDRFKSSGTMSVG